MYNIPNNIIYYVYCWDGDKRGPYNGMDEFCKHWSSYSYIRPIFGNSFKDVRYITYWEQQYPRRVETDIHCFILKDQFGDIIPPDAVYLNLNNYRNRERKGENLNFQIIGSSGSKPSNGKFFRRPKTQRNRRWANAYDDIVRVRSRRSKASLPTSWGDILIKSRQNNNWKGYRKTQYITKIKKEICF